MQAPATSKRVKRIYKGTDPQMLASCLVQVDNLSPIQADLAQRRKSVTPAHLTTLRQDITTAIETKLGLNPQSLVQELTGELKTAQTTALGLFSSFNLDLRDAFNSQPDKARLRELSARLGLREHYAAAQSRNQQALGALIAAFITATNDAALRLELEDTLEISSQLIDDIRAQQKFYELDIAQEKGKSDLPVITDDSIRTFNDLYRRVQSLARLARDLNKADAARAAQFSYSRIRARMKGGTPNPDQPAPNPAP